MLLIHAGVHRTRYRELVAAKPLAHEELPEPFTVNCPTCGDLYVAELDPYEEPTDLEEQEWDAVTALEDGCPDHPHFIETGT